jgi:hypothetical protein
MAAGSPMIELAPIVVGECSALVGLTGTVA